MGYNIDDVGGGTGVNTSPDGTDAWAATLDLSVSSVTTVTGDFNEVRAFFGDLGDANSTYTFSALSNPSFGTLTSNSVDGTYTFTPNWANILATGSDQVVSFTVTGVNGTDTNTDTVTITLLICVARGTLIETRNGALPVEQLAVDDTVTTADGRQVPIRWIGCRALSRAELETRPELRPIVIAPEALGPAQPRRRLTVSPQHRIRLADWRAELMFGSADVLVPAKALINDRNIQRDNSCTPIEYFHLLFDQHEIILTEGAETESFHPNDFTVSALDDAARRELITLFPELESETGYGSTAFMVLRPWEANLLHPPKGGTP